MALIVIAVARPQTGQAREIIKGEGVDIALALDISGSMASLDFEPQNRLEAAKACHRRLCAGTSLRPDRPGGLCQQRLQPEPADDRPQRVAAPVGPHQAGHRPGHRRWHSHRHGAGQRRQHAQGLGCQEQGRHPADRWRQQRRRDRSPDGGRKRPRRWGSRSIPSAWDGLDRYRSPWSTPLAGSRSSIRKAQLDEATLQEIADVTGGRYFRAEDTAGLKADL